MKHSKLFQLSFMLLVGLFISTTGTAQKKISGIIQDATTNSPLGGATIILQNNSKTHTIADNKGKFEIEIPGGEAVLVVSFIGYNTQNVAVGASETNVVVKLIQSSSDLLNQVVVIGFGTQKKKDITASVSTINSKDINGIPVGGIAQIMQGKAAGVSITQVTGAPGAGVTVRIRGIGTINNNDPLYVIDGVATEDGINEISPNDIESISILKDAASASIYGARASNGVVVITTKKGKTGKPTVRLNAYTGSQTPERLIKMANTSQYVKAYNIAATNDGRPLIPLGMLDTLADVNWQKEVLRSAPMSNVQLSLGGGSESTTYMVSANYFTQDGMINNSSNERFNLRTSVTSKISKIFKVGTNVNFAYNKTKQVGSSGDGFGDGNPGPSVMRYALFRAPASPVRNKDGTFVDIPNPPTFFGDGLNPVGLAANTDRKFNGYSLLGNVFLEVTPIHNLKLKSNFGTNLIITDYKQFYPTWGSSTRLQNSPNALDRSNENNFNYDWTNTATYDWRMDKHAVTILAGTEIIFNDTKNFSGSNTTFPNQTTTFQYLNNATSTTPSVGGNESNASLSSVFGRIDYQYDNKYLANFNFRRDGSSRLAPGNRWGNFYSGSVGWIISRERFMENVNVVSNLKLRASLGQLGNQEISNYGYASLMGSTGFYAFGNSAAPTYTIYAKGNPDIKWETSTMSDVGLDLGLFDGSISFTVDYYRKVTSNLLVAPPDPTSAGSIAAPAFENNGKILNRGFEFDVGYQKKINKDWHLNVSANLATVHNEVLALVNSQPIAAGRVDNNVFVTRTAVGHPIGAFYLLQQEGIFQTALDVFTSANQGSNIQPGDVKFKDVNGDGIINQDDRVYGGSPIPTITYGFTGTASFKEFDLNLFFQGVGGNKIYNQVNTELEGFYRPFNITEKTATESWHGEGTGNSIPRLSWISGQNNKQTSTRFLEDGSYLRLKNVQLGYSLSSKTLDRLKISSLRFFVSVQNVFTITRYTGLDPEMAASANAAAAGDGVKAVGIDWGTYPSARTYTVGVSVNF